MSGKKATLATIAGLETHRRKRLAGNIPSQERKEDTKMSASAPNVLGLDLFLTEGIGEARQEKRW